MCVPLAALAIGYAALQAIPEYECPAHWSHSPFAETEEVYVRHTLQCVFTGTIAAAVVAMSACKQPAADPRVEFRNQETVTITANCAAGNQVDVVVDKWVLRMKKEGDVTFNMQTTTGAAFELTQKTAESWPFDEASPVKGNAKTKIKNKNGDYRYNVRLACAIGASGDSVRVVIDPDIIVN